MASSHIVPRQLDEEIPRDNAACQECETQDQEVPVVIIPSRYAYLFRLKTKKAAMARPSDQSTKVIREKSVSVMDCGASQTITSSLINCKDMMEKVTIIETANGVESMKSKHVCNKTYFVRNQTWDLAITATDLFVKGLPQDLLGGKSVNRENIRVILDSDHDICGVFLWTRTMSYIIKIGSNSSKSKPISIIFKPRI
jgi:hypothetical protein